MIHLYIYSTVNNTFLRSEMGSPNYIFIDLKDGEDFTLTKPPDDVRLWRWMDNKWVADNTAS